MSEPDQRVLGKYEMQEELGRGGFGTVFRAIDTALDRAVAIKIMDPMLTRDAEWVVRFRKEARMMARLDHPQIVPVYDTAEELGRLYIAMKLVDGPSLSRRLEKEGALDWDQAVRIVAEIAAGLDYAHGQNVIHRDLKPGNIMLGRQGAVLTDFGLSRLIGEHSMSMTMSGGVMGTPAYLAPEVWEGKTAGPGTDIYALGCILYEMLAGERLFKGGTPPAVMRSHFQAPTLPERWGEGVPAGVGDVLLRALARDPADRYGRAGELAGELERLTADKLAGPYAALQAAIAAGRWAEAKGLAGEIRTQDPTYRDAVALEGEALAGQEREQGAAWAAQWREEAERALAEGDLEGARVAALRWQEMEVGSSKVGAFLAQLSAAAGQPTRLREERPPPTAVGHHRKRVEGARVEPVEGTHPEPVEGRPSSPATKPRLPTWTWAVGVLTALALVIVVASGLGGRSSPDAGQTSTPVPAAQVASETRPPTRTPEPPAKTPVPAAADTRAPTATLAPPTPTREPEAGEIGLFSLPAGGSVEMVYVPAGPFAMGSDEYADEQPIHTVTLDGYWIDRLEVTNAQFGIFVDETGYQTTAEEEGSGWVYGADEWAEIEGADWRHPQGPGSDLDELEEHPVVQVSWDDGVAYCEWRGARLPTEAEWEKAARGQDEWTYPWGNSFDGKKLNYCDANCRWDDWKDAEVDDGYEFTAPVGSYPGGASPYGAMDMAGNVWEWVNDWYDESYYGSSPAASRYSGSLCNTCCQDATAPAHSFC